MIALFISLCILALISLVIIVITIDVILAPKTRIHGIDVLIDRWWVLFGLGIALGKNTIAINTSRASNDKSYVYVKGTIQTIQHEFQHLTVVRRLGYFNFFFTELWRYITKGWKGAEWEQDAIAKETGNDIEIELDIKNYCIKNNLKYY